MEEPEKKQIPEQTVISMEHVGAYGDIGRVYHSLHGWARKRKVKSAGPGFTIFHSPASEFDSSSAIFEVCIPVETAPEADAKVKAKTLPACTVASVTVKGPYSEIPFHYTEMVAWLDAEGWAVAGPPREVYIKHPDAKGGGDPKEFVTEIQFPVEA